MLMRQAVGASLPAWFTRCLQWGADHCALASNMILSSSMLLCRSFYGYDGPGFRRSVHLWDSEVRLDS